MDNQVKSQIVVNSIRLENNIYKMVLTVLCLLFFNITFFLPLPEFFSIVSLIIYLSYLSIRLGLIIIKRIEKFQKHPFAIAFILGYSILILEFFIIAVSHGFFYFVILALLNIKLLAILVYDIIKLIKNPIKDKLSFYLFKRDFLKRYIKNNSFLLIMVSFIFLFHLILYFIGSQIGVDTFRINYLAYILIKDGSLSFNDNFFAMLQLVPYSQFPIPVVLTASLSIVSRISFESSILVQSIFLSLIGLFGFWVYLKEIYKFRKTLLSIAIIAFVFSPLFLKFFDWTLTGRTVVLAFIPISIYMIDILITQKKGLKILYLLMIILSFFVIVLFSHRMAYYLPAYFIIRGFIELVLSNKKIKNRDKAHVISNLVISIIGFLTFILPLFIWLLGRQSLVVQWFVYYIKDLIFYIPLRDNTSSLINLTIILGNFSLLFLIRLSWIFPLFFIEIFNVPRKSQFIAYSEEEIVNRSYLSIKLFVATFFLLFFRAMYIYQTQFIFMIIIALIGLKRLFFTMKSSKEKIMQSTIAYKLRNSLRSFSLKIKRINLSKTYNYYQKNKTKIYGFTLISFTVIAGLVIEFRRYDYFNFTNSTAADYITDNVRLLSEYISDNFDNKTFYVETLTLSLQLSALSPNNYYLPNQNNLFSTYPYYNNSQSPTFSGFPNSIFELYEFIFQPFTYASLINETEISLIQNYNLTEDINSVVNILRKYNIQYVILVNEGSSILFRDLYLNGDNIYQANNLTIIDLHLRT